MVVLNVNNTAHAASHLVMSTAAPATSDGLAATAAATTVKPIHPRLFNKIVLSLENSLLPEGKLAETPSHVDGLNPDTEKDLRILGCELIQTAGILLKLPQVAMATAQVIFQRFFYSKSFVRHNMETVAMSCLCLASKIEEAPRRIRDVINVFHHIKQVRAQKDITPMILDQYYTNLKNQVIKAERRVLKELGFCVHVKHPHKLIVMYLQVLKFETHERLMQMSWNFMNDSLRTDVFLRYHPEAIACACIYLSARKLGIPLPSQPSWYGLFRVPEDDIIDICFRVMELYTRPKPNVEALELAVEELKKRYMESRNKSKEQPVIPAVTTVDRNNGSHNAWGGFIQRTIPLPLPKVEKSPDKDSRSDSHTRSRSRSGSRSSGDGGRGDGGGGDYRSSKKHRGRSRSRSRSRSLRSRSRSPRESMSKTKKKSRRYSRSPSLSPRSKHRKRKETHGRERMDYYGGSSSSKDRMPAMHDKYRDKYQDRDLSRSSGHRPSHRSGYNHGENSSSRGGGGGGASRSGGHKHRERGRDDRDREQYRSRDRKR